MPPSFNVAQWGLNFYPIRPLDKIKSDDRSRIIMLIKIRWGHPHYSKDLTILVQSQPLTVDGEYPLSIHHILIHSPFIKHCLFKIMVYSIAYGILSLFTFFFLASIIVITHHLLLHDSTAYTACLCDIFSYTVRCLTVPQMKGFWLLQLGDNRCSY